MKAIIPAAGLGTRFLPLTRAVPKEMLPIGSKPALQVIIDEALEAGCDEVLVVISRAKELVRKYFSEDPQYANRIRWVYQEEQHGLGHAVLQAAEDFRRETEDGHVLILLGDAVISGCSAAKEMVALSQANGGAARNCGLYGCYVGANTGSSPTIVNEEFVNSVYAADNSANFGDWDGNGPSRVINSILYSCVSGNHYAPKSMTNVVLIGSAKMETEGAFGTQKYATDEPLKLDADGRPTADSPLVDAGDAALVDWTADLDGGQRIYNGAVDIGCWEYDWREAFAAALGGPGLTVTAASAGVKLADGTVTLGDGDTLAGAWATGSATAVTRYAASASATDGTLAGGFVCEEPAFEKDLVATDGSASAAFKLKNAPLDFAFPFDGTGSGRLYGFDRQVRGAYLLIR